MCVCMMYNIWHVCMCLWYVWCICMFVEYMMWMMYVHGKCGIWLHVCVMYMCVCRKHVICMWDVGCICVYDMFVCLYMWGGTCECRMEENSNVIPHFLPWCRITVLCCPINSRLAGFWVPGESPVSSCHLDMGAKGFQTHRTILSLWSFWGFELGSSCFHGKCFTNWTTSPAFKQVPVPAFPWRAPWSKQVYHPWLYCSKFIF